MFEDKYAYDKKDCKVIDHSHYVDEYRGLVHNICTLKYSISKKTVVIFDIGSKHNNHFTIKEFAERFKKQITCLVGITGK